jgi:hypothetical protein
MWLELYKDKAHTPESSHAHSVWQATVRNESNARCSCILTQHTQLCARVCSTQLPLLLAVLTCTHICRQLTSICIRQAALHAFCFVAALDAAVAAVLLLLLLRVPRRILPKLPVS